MSGDFDDLKDSFRDDSSSSGSSGDGGGEDEEDDRGGKDPQDVGGYSLEEKIVSAVWVHERIRNNMSWISLMSNFRARFGSNPPAKRTLRTWERKLFFDGTVRDGVRTGRPCARLMHVPYVKASIAESPNLSLRERAQELGLPRSTLLKILKDDLKMTFVANAEHVPAVASRSFPKRRKTMVTAPTGVWKFKDTDVDTASGTKKVCKEEVKDEAKGEFAPAGDGYTAVREAAEEPGVGETHPLYRAFQPDGEGASLY